MKGAFRILEPAGEESRKAFEKAKEKWSVGEDCFSQQELADFLQKKRSTAQGYLKQWLAADMAEELLEQGSHGKKLYRLTDYIPKAQDLGLIRPSRAREKYLARQQELSSFEKSDSPQTVRTISQRELLPGADDQRWPRSIRPKSLEVKVDLLYYL